MREGNLSLVEAARVIGVSPHTLRTWAVYQRRIAYLKAGRRLLFPLEEVEAFERGCRVEAHPSPARR